MQGCKDGWELMALVTDWLHMHKAGAAPANFSLQPMLSNRMNFRFDKLVGKYRSCEFW